MKVKQPTLELDKKGVVYEVPCGECNHVYIGETGRTLRKRLVIQPPSSLYETSRGSQVCTAQSLA